MDNGEMMQLITNLNASLERQMMQGFKSLSDKLDAQAARMERRLAWLKGRAQS